MIGFGRGWRERCYNVTELRLAAKAALPRAVFDFTDGAAEDEKTLRRNEQDFDRHVLMAKPLDGPGISDPSITLFGRKLSMPLMIGPTGLAGLMWPDGEACAARAAAKAGTGYCLSHGSVSTLEVLPKTGGFRMFQVFVYSDRGFTEELAQRAAASGYDALVLTVDNQALGNRERDVRNGWTIPPKFSPADILAMTLKAPWLLRMRNEIPRITFGNYVRNGEKIDVGSLAKRMSQLLDPSMSWKDVERLRQVWKGPLILKGIMHPDEAKRAADYGIDAVIASNHGGRQIDGAISGIRALPLLVEAVQGRMPVFVDGGIRRGADVVKALALGAACCFIARPQLWGLAVAGEDGVHHMLENFRREIVRTMILMGTRTVADIGPNLIARADQ